MNVRDIQRIARFIEAIGFAVVWKLAANLEPRSREQITQRVLVFMAIESPLRCASLAGIRCLFFCGQMLCQRGQQNSESRPRLLQIASIRRGLVAGLVCANTGCIASRNGNASVMPAPFSSVRLDSGLRVAKYVSLAMSFTSLPST